MNSPLARGSRATTARGRFPLRIAVMAKHDGGGLGQLHRQFGGQQAVRQTPDTICSK